MYLINKNRTPLLVRKQRPVKSPLACIYSLLYPIEKLNIYKIFYRYKNKGRWSPVFCLRFVLHSF